MDIKKIYIGLLILFIILLLIIINRNRLDIKIDSEEYFSNKIVEEEKKDDKFSKSGYIVDSAQELTTTTETATQSSDQNQWTTDKTVLETTDAVLKKLLSNDNEYNTSLKNMISSVNQSQLKTLIATQSPLLVGPQGVPGPQGPAGTTLIASGRLINKSTTGEDNIKNNFVVTRTDGTNSSSSLSFIDNLSPFASFQYWQLDVNNNLINKYDQSCLTMSPTQSKLFMDKCSKDNDNQKWAWDSTNRLISTTASTDKKLKCIGLSKPETNVLTTNIPGCIGNQCLNNNPHQYLEVKDCDINNINEDEIWSFI